MWKERLATLLSLIHVFLLRYTTWRCRLPLSRISVPESLLCLLWKSWKEQGFHVIQSSSTFCRRGFTLPFSPHAERVTVRLDIKGRRLSLTWGRNSATEGRQPVRWWLLCIDLEIRFVLVTFKGFFLCSPLSHLQCCQVCSKVSTMKAFFLQFTFRGRTRGNLK